jgi:predicted transporter
MHTDVFWVVANIVFLIIGVKLGLAFAPAQRWRRLAAVITATAIGAAAITILVGLLGEAAAAFAAGGAVVWLVVARWLRP